MWFTSWLRNGNQSGASERRRTYKSTRRRPARRLALEVLEGRVVPSTLTVTTTADSGAGALRTEINLAHSGDTIIFAPSLSHQTIALINGEMPINKNLTIQGLGASQLTVSGNGRSRVFDLLRGAQVTLSGLTINHGSSVNSPVDAFAGGAIFNQGTLTLSGCTVSYSTAPSYGGGIYNLGTLTLSGCTVSNDKANVGSGIYNAASATLTISQSTLSGDIANGFFGGGIYNAGTLTVSNSTLSGDSASYGGGIYNRGTATVSGCTLSGDSAASFGGGIYSALSAVDAGALTVLDSIFSSNTPDNINGYYTDGGGNTFS